MPSKCAHCSSSKAVVYTLTTRHSEKRVVNKNYCSGSCLMLGVTDIALTGMASQTSKTSQQAYKTTVAIAKKMLSSLAEEWKKAEEKKVA